VLESVDSDGCVEPPMGPGLGVTIDWDYVNHHLVTKNVYPE
jgi:L-alanine-DL-glutamate epimerase-like enolase superfamily enzyme